MSTSTYAYQKKWRLDREQGITRFIDPTPARNHITCLLNATGASRRAVAEAAGVGPSLITRLLTGDQKRIRRTTAARILAVRPAQLRKRQQRRGFVPKIGTVRRIQALHAIGHSTGQIAAATGGQLTTAAITNVVHQSGEWITTHKREAILTAYRALAGRPGSNPWTLGKARKAGWPSPLAWGDDIDDPNARPHTGARDADPGDTPAPAGAGVDEQAITRAILTPGSVPLTRAERLELIRRLAARGRPDNYIAHRAGVTARTVARVRAAENIPSRWTA